MTKVVVLGAGIGGVPMAFELREQLGRKAEITVVSESEWFQFVPSNPWVAVNWRKPDDVKVHLPEVFKKLNIGFTAVGAERVKPAEKRSSIARRIDALIRLSGDRDRPEARLRRSRRTGADGEHAVRLPCRSRGVAGDRWEEFCKNPGPMVVGAVQGASCFGPAYEYALTVGRRSAQAQDPRSRADHLRHLRALYRPSWPRRRRRHQGHARIGHARSRHQMDHQRESRPHQRRLRRGHRSQRRRSVKKDAQAPVEILRCSFPPSAASIASRAKTANGSKGSPIRAASSPSTSIRETRPIQNIFAVGVCIAIPPYRADARSDRRAKDRLHDRIHGARRPRITFAISSPARSQRMKAHGTRSASPTSATAASPLSRCRKSRRATSTGRGKAIGCIWRKSPSRNISCARFVRDRASRYMNAFMMKALGIVRLRSGKHA